MTNPNNDTTTNAWQPIAVALLFLTLGFAFTAPVAAAPQNIGGSVTMDITLASATTGGTYWFTGSGAQPVTLTVTRGSENIDTVTFSILDPAGAAPNYNFVFGDPTADQTGWTSTTSSRAGDTGDDTITFESPAPSTQCQLLGQGCPNMEATGTFSFTLTPQMASDLPAREFTATASGSNFVGDDSARVLIGFDQNPPTGAITLSGTNFGGFYNDLTNLQAAFTTSDGTGSGVDTIEYRLNGGAYSPATTPILLAGAQQGSNTLELLITDFAGLSHTVSETFWVDSIAPVLTATLGTDGNAGFGKVGDTLSVSFSANEPVTLTAASIAGENVLGSLDANTVSLPLSGNEPEGTATFSLSFRDDAGNLATTTTSNGDPITIDFTAPAVTDVSINAGDDNEAGIGEAVTVSLTSPEALLITGTIGGVAIMQNGNTAAVFVNGNSFPDNSLVTFDLAFSDLAGNSGTNSPVSATTDGSQVLINYGDRVATTIEIDDTFLPTGELLGITATTTWAEDPDGAGPLDVGAPYGFGRQVLYRDGVQVASRTSSALGTGMFTVTAAEAAEYDYVVAIVGNAADPDTEASEMGSIEDRSAAVTFTHLNAAVLGVEDNVLSPGAAATFNVALTWAHDDSAATGLDVSALQLAVEGQPGGNDPRNLLPATPASGSMISFTETATPGTYGASYTHEVFESIAFDNLVGSVSDGGLGGANSDFDVPALTASAFVHWIGAYVDSLTFANDDDALDPTGHFVNLDDAVTITAHVVYTPNYDPSDVDGLLQAGEDPAAASGVTVALFETGSLDGASAPATNGDATLTAPADVGGNAAFNVASTTFSQVALRDGANTYGLQAFPVAIPGINDQSIVQANAGDLDEAGDLTFTALDLAYVPDSVTGLSDNDGRWWLDMDNAKGDETNPGQTDELSFTVHVTWRHDGANVEGATVGVLRDDLPLDAAVELAGLSVVTDPAGQATLVIDPDDYDLDALVTSLEAVAQSAPEPNELGGTITQAGDTFVQEVLWSRIALDLGFQTGSDGEVDLGATVGLTLQPVYYHTEGNAAGGYYLGDGSASEGVDDVDFDASLDDTTNAGLATMSAIGPVSYTAGNALPLLFDVTGGCADPDGACTPAVAQAGYHTYQADVTAFSSAPHGLSVDGSTLDVLYTAVVLDTATDRLTAPVDTSISIVGQAYYAHATDLDGQPLDPVAYTGGVTVNVLDDATSVASALALTDGVIDVVVPGAAAAGHHDLLVEGVSLADDGTDAPLTLVFDGPTMERVWLALDVGAVTPERTLQIRGRDVAVEFTLAYTDGASTVVDGINEGYAFGPVDDNVDDRFDASPATTPATSPATAALVGPGGESFAAAYDGDCGCWVATLTGYGEVADDLPFDVVASVPLTVNAAGDVGTTVSSQLDDEFTVTFSAISLDVLESGNSAYQDDLGQFWYNLGTAATYTVEANWQHAGQPAALGVDLLVQGLAGATIQDNGDGTYAVSVPSPLASGLQVQVLGVTGVDSPVIGEAAFTDAAPFALGASSLVDTLTTLTVVHTQVQLIWAADYDGAFVNRQQGTIFDFGLQWDHDLSKVDKPSTWEVDFGGAGPDASFFTAVHPGTLVTTGGFDVTRLSSGAVSLQPEIVTAPRGINVERIMDDGGDLAIPVSVTWTALQMSIQAPATATTGSTVSVNGKAELQHDLGAFLEGASIKLAGSAKTTVADGFAPGTPGATVNVKAINPGMLTVRAEGVSYDPGVVLGSSLITASTDASTTITFA